MPDKKVCLIVAYRDPRYIRTRTLRAALQSLDSYRFFDATNARRGVLRYVETLVKLIRIRLQYNPDIYILGFRGHEIFFLVKLLTMPKTLIFDEFMSPSEALLTERKLGFIGRFLGYVSFPLEKACLRISDRCLTDTRSHKDFIQERFAVPGDKINVVYVGADFEPGSPAQPDRDVDPNVNGLLKVLFYGTFAPLHGMDVILKACDLVRDEPLEFEIIGGKGRALQAFKDKCASLNLTNVRHHTWVAFAKLQSVHIPRADLCLGGPFGGTPQALRVITGKTLQFLAQGKATVVGRTDEPAGFRDRENCLLVNQAEPVQLAETLRWAVEHREKLAAIGLRGRELFARRFSTARLAVQLASALEART